MTKPKEPIISGAYEIFRGDDGRLWLKREGAAAVSYENDIDLIAGIKMTEGGINKFDKAERRLTRVSKYARARLTRARKAHRLMKRRDSWKW